MNSNEPISIGSLFECNDEEELFCDDEIVSYVNGYPV